MSFSGTWMDLEMILLSEVCQTVRDKYCDITYKYIFKMIQMNLFTKQN